ncbi:hypothetical protein HMPREF0620_0802 [Parascardovia denticolens DSM 10105 = JCM 12538]|uniref:Uncharacterized protein n=1 Tax=Parascardovia denticolens DSM 10105 = JCM 12538 TaxID=864564 RepID=E6JYC0_PARDN|nr:hypothetical protein HMPREF0620_0802 [Parascardovia denticolens DSM 10105 = JCM 12538]
MMYKRNTNQKFTCLHSGSMKKGRNGIYEANANGSFLLRLVRPGRI